MAASFLAPLLLVLARAGTAQATIKWNTKTIVFSNWTVDFTNYNEEPIPNPCPNIGVCQPGIVNLQPNTTWIWCNGWQAIHRTQFWLSVQNATANISAVLMPESEVNNCAVATKGAGIKNCGIIDTSPYACDTKTKCYVKVVGLVFQQNICLVVANNNLKDGQALNVSVQMWNYWDQPRYIGTVFTILLFVAWCLGMIIFFAVSCTIQWRAPPHRLEALAQLDRFESHVPEDDKVRLTPAEQLKQGWSNLKQRLHLGHGGAAKTAE